MNEKLARIKSLREAAHAAQARALSAEAQSQEGTMHPGDAERAAFLALEAIDDLARYAEELANGDAGI